MISNEMYLDMQFGQPVSLSFMKSNPKYYLRLRLVTDILMIIAVNIQKKFQV
jgi:hypothetical protein